MRVLREIEINSIFEFDYYSWDLRYMHKLCGNFEGLEEYLLDYLEEYSDEINFCEVPNMDAVQSLLDGFLTDDYFFGRVMYPYLFGHGYKVTACKVYAACEEGEDWYGSSFDIVGRLQCMKLF